MSHSSIQVEGIHHHHHHSSHNNNNNSMPTTPTRHHHHRRSHSNQNQNHTNNNNPFDDEEDNDKTATSLSSPAAPPTRGGDHHHRTRLDYAVGNADDHHGEGGGKCTASASAGSSSAAQQQQPPAPPPPPPSAEASWQYLGDLPYRRIPIYSNVVWHHHHSNNNKKKNTNNAMRRRMVDGLACMPMAALQQYTHTLASTAQTTKTKTPAKTTNTTSTTTSAPPQQQQPQPVLHHMSPREMQQLMATVTETKVVGCPHGGPLAMVTLPRINHQHHRNRHWSFCDIQICTNSGQELSTIRFPPPDLLGHSPVATAGGGGAATTTTTTTTKGTSTLSSATTTSVPSASSTHSSTTLPAKSSFSAKNDDSYDNNNDDYSPADLVQLGFTRRTRLILVLRDSTILVYSVQGQRVLPPFVAIVPSPSEVGGEVAGGVPPGSVFPASASSAFVQEANNNNEDSDTPHPPPHYDHHHPTTTSAAATATTTISTTTSTRPGVVVIQACVYEGGVALLTSQNIVVLVELLDDRYDDVEQYQQSAHASVRRIDSTFSSSSDVALITLFPTRAHATLHHCHYLTLCVLSKLCTPHGHPEVLVSTHDHSVLVANARTLDLTDVNCRTRISGPLVLMSVAPNGRFLAVFTAGSHHNHHHHRLTVMSTNFETKILDFDTTHEGTASTLPCSVHWCGEDCVVLQWQALGVLLIGPYGDWVRIASTSTSTTSITTTTTSPTTASSPARRHLLSNTLMDRANDEHSHEAATTTATPTTTTRTIHSSVWSLRQVHLVPDMDGCRLISESSVELLQRVPPGTAQLLRIGSIEPAAMLLDASEAYYNYNHHHHSSYSSSSTTTTNAALTSYTVAEDAARAIVQTGRLNEAIEACTEAAAREFDIVTQKRLLRAASYGMHFASKQQNHHPTKGGMTTTMTDAANTFLGEDPSVVMGGPTVDSSRKMMMMMEDKENADEKLTLLPSPTAIHFVVMARKLRVLNALRHPRVGFVLTLSQFDAITPAGVIARLVENFSRPALAVAIAKYLQLPRSVQLYARASQACTYITTAAAATSTHTPSIKALSDSEIAETAIRIIHGQGISGSIPSLTNSNGPVSSSSYSSSFPAHPKSSRSDDAFRHRGAYATVAMAANNAGRKGVANLLLMLESSVADKVPALIATGSFTDAIAVATAARDADLIFLTLLEYEKACLCTASSTDVPKAQATYLSTVVSKFTPEAFHTLRRYLLMTANVKSVTNLLIRAQKFTDAGSYIAHRALKEIDLREKLGVFAEASRVFALSKDTNVYKSSTDDYIELLKDQEVVRTKYGSREVIPDGASVAQTIASMLHFAGANAREQHRLLSDADKIAKKFRVSDKRLWHIKLAAFAESAQWSNVRILADSKKSPIGYKPFARASIRGKQPVEQTMRFIDRVTVSEEKYALLCEAGLWSKALDEAFRLRDPRRILNVKSLCNSSELQLQADQVLARLA